MLSCCRDTWHILMYHTLGWSQNTGNVKFLYKQRYFGEKIWLLMYINAKIICSAALYRVSRQIEVNENLAQMHLKTPITVCMCFRQQNPFKNVFFCPVSLVWCYGEVCSQIQLPARASLTPMLRQGPCLQVFPALLLQGSADAAPCPLCLPCFRTFCGPDRTWGFHQ